MRVGAAEERSQCESFSRWDRVSWSAREISPRWESEFYFFFFFFGGGSVVLITGCFGGKEDSSCLLRCPMFGNK